MHGILILDKRSGMTSRDALNRAQGWFPRRTKLGHAGTLDPLATGVLVACIGDATRLIEYVQQMSKVYHTTIVFGATSDTDDADGTLTPHPNARPIAFSEIEEHLPAFVGTIQQVPPAYSATMVEGRRAYALARKGHEVELTPRPVQIDAIEVQRYEFPRLELAITCGKGTYIRSIARDLGERLGVGGYVETLRRVRIGGFTTEMAIDIETTRDDAHSHIRPMREALGDRPLLTLDDLGWERIRHGNPAIWSTPLHHDEAGILRDGELVATVRIDHETGRLHPTRVFDR